MLKLSEDIPSSRSSQAPNQTRATTLFAPRKLGPSKPRAGLGKFKKDQPGETVIAAAGSLSSGSASKGQDDFRKMLSGGK